MPELWYNTTQNDGFVGCTEIIEVKTIGLHEAGFEKKTMTNNCLQGANICKDIHLMVDIMFTPFIGPRKL